MSWAECAECGLVFTSDSAFDAHRIFTCGHRHRGFSPTDGCWETRRCLTEGELLDRHWRTNRKGRWTPYPPREAVLSPPQHESRAEAV
jgi:hypothetical protein